MIQNQREQFNRVQKEITSALTVSIYTHVNPDCDTLSCALALYNSLTKLGKQVDVYCVDPVSETLKILSGADVVKVPEKKVHDLSIAVDCDGLDRIGNAMRSYLSSKMVPHMITKSQTAGKTVECSTLHGAEAM